MEKPARPKIGKVQEELINGLTHGIGFLLSLVACVILVFSSLGTTVWHIVGCTIYSITLVLLYGASTGYHLFRNRRLKRTFRILDHACIYLLIAGTYTPFMLATLRDEGGLLYLAIIWTIAFFGILLKVFFTGRFNIISTLSYIVAGWLVVMVLGPLTNHLSFTGVAWLGAGGVAYTSGVVFFLNDRRKYFHAIWHLFVMAGSACQYVAILYFVLP